MKLLVEIPSNCISERTYILGILLREFLGIEFHLRISESLNLTRIVGQDSKAFVVDDCFFSEASRNWLGKSSMPQEPFQFIELADLPLRIPSLKPNIPVLYATVASGQSNLIEIVDNKLVCHIDIFGTCFFLLSRYEEAASSTTDEFGRFPFSESVLSRDGLIKRPLVNEYLELLWSCLNSLWPELKRTQRYYQAILTHDVDRPFLMTGVSIPGLFKKLGAAMLHYRSWNMTKQRFRGFVRGLRGDINADPFNTFDFMMDIAEQYLLRSAFYFIADRSAGNRDCNYTLEDTWIRALIRRIHERGHEIGMHGSFNTYKNEKQTARELGMLKAACLKEGIGLKKVGGRQHYLRWSVSHTWDIWDSVGMNYDSSVGFAEHAGFRAGTCYEYPVYSLENRKMLSLKERPLIVMDGTLMTKKYMGLDYASSLSVVKELINVCRFYNGDFVFLFHNSSLETEAQKHHFAKIVSLAA